MTEAIDETLVYMTKRRPRKKGGLSASDCVALNLFWRRHVKVSVLAQVFQVSRNTIYCRALTSQYPGTHRKNTAKDINDLIERMGEKAAWKSYVTPRMKAAVNKANKQLAKAIQGREP